MNKQQFLAAIEKKLSNMPQEDIKTSIDYYEEMLNDRIDDGMTEEEAVADMGSVDEITAQILAEPSLAQFISSNIEKIKPNRALKAWEIVLIVLGSPLWISLLAAVFAVAVALAVVALALYMVMWTLAAVLWIIMLSFGLCAVAGVGWGIACLFIGKPLLSLLGIGGGLVCAGLGVLMFFLSLIVTKGMAKGTADLWKLIFGKKK